MKRSILFAASWLLRSSTTEFSVNAFSVRKYDFGISATASRNFVGTVLGMNNSKRGQRRVETILDNLEEPFLTTKPTEVGKSVEDDDLVPLVECIAKAADMRKAEDIKCIRVSKLTTTTSFVVIVSGNSRPQNRAIAAAIDDEVMELFEGEYALRGDSPEGNADSGWILLDYGCVMVHVMTPRSRLFYDIEGKWKKGEQLDITSILVPNTPDSSSNDGSIPIDTTDPFWS